MSNRRMLGIAARVLSGAAILLPLSFSAHAEDEPLTQTMSVTTKAISNELLETVTSEDILLNSQVALRAFGQFGIPVNEHFYDFDILEAETIKKDGRHIPVPPDRILKSEAANAPTLGIFDADTKTRTIVFPDLEIGDSVHFKSRSRQKAVGLPGGFSVLRTASPASRLKSYEFTLDVPEGTKLSLTVEGFTASHEIENGRERYRWTLNSLPFKADEPTATAAIDRNPIILVSSFSSDNAIAQTFYDMAAPKAVPSPAITALAEEITRGKADRKDQARAIYDYVSTKVRYVAVLLGTGGWVPHPADEVLTTKYVTARTMSRWQKPCSQRKVLMPTMS
jgi:hypothetical protein